MFSKFILAVCGLMLTVKSQNILYTTPQEYGKVHLTDQDKIYFLEDPLSVQPAADNRNVNQGNGDSYYTNTGSVQSGFVQNANTSPLQEYSPNINGGQALPISNRVPEEANRGQLNQNTYYPGDRNGDGNFGNQHNVPSYVNLPKPVLPGPISHSVTNFGLNLLKNIQQNGKNLVMSPFSITTLLALLQQGATGVTGIQIMSALQMTSVASAAAYKNITEDIQKRNSNNVLNVANNIYVADDFIINPEFKKMAVKNFASEVTPIKFNNPGRAAQIINNWVASKTHNKITNLVPPDAIDENAQLILVNAVYFKGVWQIRFNPDSTHQNVFNLSNGSSKTTSFMRMRRYFRSGIDKTNDAMVLILPFEQEQYSLMLILPSLKSNVPEVLATLTDSKLLDYHQFTHKEIEVQLPKFTIRADTDLNLALRKMGVVDVFGAQSELSGLGKYGTQSPHISSAIHSAMLSIDEKGGSAAAATAFAVVALSYDDPSLTFVFNRPFLAVLWDNKAAVPLFMADIENPVL
ncbi:leukocyte elastase inhibitor-like [Galleria mellonella]|uniref:Leukocyte elastase inhibitor-like n=1 Tax=Galleria mellonella TaxID=7137 RepID=A0A6J1WYU5_GALME|nr:leukocyte elastase inhibitor-like [Galleria mellonella]